MTKFPNTEKFLELCEIEKELTSLFNTVQGELTYIQDKKSNDYSHQTGRLLGIRAGIITITEKIERNDKLLEPQEKKNTKKVSKINNQKKNR